VNDTGGTTTGTTTRKLGTTQQLDHIEMVYRPCERDLASRVFDLLGMRVIDHGGEWLVPLVDPSIGDVRKNACCASEMTPQQRSTGSVRPLVGGQRRMMIDWEERH
jgi:hypothetical protein